MDVNGEAVTASRKVETGRHTAVAGIAAPGPVVMQPGGSAFRFVKNKIRFDLCQKIDLSNSIQHSLGVPEMQRPRIHDHSTAGLCSFYVE